MFDFDQSIDRLNTGSNKWSKYPPDVLPLWVADMDFAATPPILDALQQRLSHPVLGYAVAEPALRQQIAAYVQARYHWSIEPQDVVLLPGVEPGFNMALKAFCQAGHQVMMHTPVYKPLLQAPEFWGLHRHDLPLHPDPCIALDLEAFDRAAAQSSAWILCNPHNPLGRVFERDTLLKLAQSCVAHNTLIISDEIHCDLLYDGRRHTPIASLSPQIAKRTITLMSASKTYNIAGLKTAFAIIPDPELRQRFDKSRLGMVDSVNLRGLQATQAALAHCGAWREALLRYLQSNRDVLVQSVARLLPGVVLHAPQATFLAWLDCSALKLGQDAQKFFLEHARVALSPGLDFGSSSDQWVRLNFGCTRAVLSQALARMQTALRSYTP